MSLSMSTLASSSRLLGRSLRQPSLAAWAATQARRAAAVHTSSSDQLAYHYHGPVSNPATDSSSPPNLTPTDLHLKPSLQPYQKQIVTQPWDCPPPSSSNPSTTFPCVDANERRAQKLRQQFASIVSHNAANPSPDLVSQDELDQSGPEPAYSKVVSGYQLFHHAERFPLDYGGELPKFDVAYETWGTLSANKDNVILIHTGLSASSHAASTPSNPSKGWWENFIGPNKPIDTNKFFVICTNVLGGCYGSTGPSSSHPQDPTGAPYATRFPIVSVFDMVRAQFLLLDHLGIDKLYASVGSSMGGMQSIAAAHLYRDRVERLVSISGCARSAPASIALRYTQRSVLMSDPNWNRGFYYASGSLPPHTGMKLARQIATFTYRSGPEWEQRFGRARRVSSDGDTELDPALCPDFLIETYLDHQGEQFCLKYDANSLIYISKAMDLFDMSDHALVDLERRRTKKHGDEIGKLGRLVPDDVGEMEPTPMPRPGRRPHISTLYSPSAHNYVPSLARGLSRLADIPSLVIGVQSDILFPVEQQREIAECLRRNGNDHVRYYEIDAPHGHDSFLIDVANVGGALKGFLS